MQKEDARNKISCQDVQKTGGCTELLVAKLRALCEAFGNEVSDTVQEKRELEISRSKSVVGGVGLLKDVAAWSKSDAMPAVLVKLSFIAMVYIHDDVVYIFSHLEQGCD